MSSNLPGGGGVRSLRAMFESSHPERSASPEARGRSPTPGSPSVRSSESNSRPTSKVRASFISVGPFDSPPTSMPGENGENGENGVESPAVGSPAVESPGDSPIASPPTGAIAALRAAAPSESGGSTVTQRRGSMSLDPNRDSEVLEELRHTVSSEADHRRASVDIQETVPENAVFTGPTNTPFMEIKEDNAMGTFIDNDDNKWQDAKKASEPGPKAEATNENARNLLEEAAKGLKRVEIAAEEKKSDSNHKSSDASDATATTPTPATTAPPPAAEEPKKDDVALPVEEPTMTQPDKKTDVEDASAEMKPSDPKEESAVSGGEALPPPTESLKPLGVEKTAEEAPAPAPAAEEKAEEKVEPKPEEKANVAPEPVPEAEKTPAPAEESKPAGGKSPVPPGTPTSPIASPKSTTSKTSSAKEPAKRTSRTSLKSATSSSAAKPRASSRPAAEKKGTHATPPFTKPRPKSPTRPAKLPSHLTAPTAASAARREAEKAEEKKAAAKPKTTTPRAPAVASKTTTAAAHKNAAEKKAGSRPSLPAQSTAKRPESRTSRPSVGARAPDDSFLARMMRPTAASASKTHEKKDDVKSPPRRQTSVKAKQANGSGVAAKAKTKVAEGIDKAKEKVLDKDSAEEKKEEEEEKSTGPSLEPALPITEKPVEEEKAAEAEGKNTPPQDAETPEQQSGETMTQTPAGLEGGVIRTSPGRSPTTTLATLVEEAPQIIRSPPQQQHLFPDAAAMATTTPTSGSTRALRSFSNASSMTAYSSTSTAFTTASTAATSVYGGSTPTSSYISDTSTPSSVSVCGDIPPAKPVAAAAPARRGRISNLVAFFEKNQ